MGDIQRRRRRVRHSPETEPTPPPAAGEPDAAPPDASAPDASAPDASAPDASRAGGSAGAPQPAEVPPRRPSPQDLAGLPGAFALTANILDPEEPEPAIRPEPPEANAYPLARPGPTLAGGHPEHTRSDHARTEPARTEPARTEPAQTEQARSQHVRPYRPDHGRQEHSGRDHVGRADSRPAHENLDHGKHDHGRHDHGRQEHGRQEHSRPEHHERYDAEAESTTERGLRGLVGGGSSQVSVMAAMRARDAARPTDDDLAAAERDLVVVRRGWIPREDLPRSGRR